MVDKRAKPQPLLFTSSDWSFGDLDRVYEAIKEIAEGEMNLDFYPNQIEVISSEQMLDAYSSIGMPLMYQHWSFGKHFLHESNLYRRGRMGLAYELVINSNPCITYLMEENTMALQTLVIAHASFGHNHFFKNNYLFQQWTDAGAILAYMEFAKSYIARCEERYGPSAVEGVLDAAHALMPQAVFRYRRRPRLSVEREQARIRERLEHEERTFSDLWRTLPQSADASAPREPDSDPGERQQSIDYPEENLLYFLEKYSPVLKPWQREILRIVRVIAQYFYPQRQTKVMNEGCATFVHYTIMNSLYDKGRISEGTMLEVLQNHSNVVFQPGFDDPRYGGLNPYTLGFNMMRDIQRICLEPTAEDRDWFPEFAGNGDWCSTLLDAWASHRDESFIRQFLSPALIRDMRLFSLREEATDPYYEVTAIHDERGYERVRSRLADSYDVGMTQPDIQAVDADLKGDRKLRLRHTVHNGGTLVEETRNETLRYVQRLWGHEVSLVGIDGTNDKTLYEVSTKDLAEKA